ncbi:MAG: DUF362 domain-containing protein [Candidatus Eisenbacteria bacterium]|nr:DUF362 domain-containing protein [Candidatus Eisenbacteria bacterium]
MKSCTRREALTRMGVGAALLAGGGFPARAQAASSLALARNGEPEALTRAAIDALGGMGRFVPRGATVVLKPNIGWDRAPEQAANTHPAVVAILVTLALEAGAAKVRVMDHTCNDARRCYRRSGIQESAEQAGADLLHLRDGRGTQMHIGGELIGDWPVHREVVEADVLINVPIAKHHSLTRASLGMKNWLGAIGGRRNQLHQNVPLASVDLAAFFKPQLTVLDGTRVLLRNGPQGGDPADVSHPRVLMAGVDPVAIDAFGGTLLDLTPDDLPHLAMATARGLGSIDWDRSDLARIDLGA